MAQKVKNPPAMQEMRVRSLGREDPLEEEMATHSCILAWRIPWTEGYSPWRATVHGVAKRWDTTECLTLFAFVGRVAFLSCSIFFFFFYFLPDYRDPSEATFQVAPLFIVQMPPKFGQVCESHSQALRLSELSFLTHSAVGTNQ